MQFNGFALTDTFTVASTPAVKTFALGYQPSAVKMAVISGTNKGAELYWNDKMPAGSALLRAAAGTATVPLSNGITAVADIAVTDGEQLNDNLITLAASITPVQYQKGFSLGILTGFADTAGDVIVVESFRAAK